MKRHNKGSNTNGAANRPVIKETKNKQYYANTTWTPPNQTDVLNE